MFRILVADDEDFIRRGIIAILKRNLPSETVFLKLLMAMKHFARQTQCL